MNEPSRSRRGVTGACLGVCLAVVLIWFSPWWAGGRVLAPLDLPNEMMQPWRGGGEPGVAKNHFVSDGITVILTNHLFASESYRNEGRVGWSDMIYGGTAQYADTMALHDDWSMQLHRYFDFWTAWHLGLMGQVLVSASGMVLLLRGRGANAVWSTCGGLAFAANSQFVTWIFHRFALSAFCWVPWILWAIDCHRRGRHWCWTLVPLFIALAFLGSTLQHAVIVVLAVTASWGEEAWQTWRKRGGGFPAQARVLGRYAVWGLLGVGLSAMMFLPCVDALLTSNGLGLHTGLFAGAEKSIYPQGNLQPLYNLAAYPFQVFPSLLGRCDSIDLLKLFKSELFFVAYIGALPTLVAFLAVGWRKTSPLARLLILIGLFLPLTPAVRYLYQRLLFLFLLGGTLAFVSFMGNSTDEARRKLCKVVAWMSGVAALGWLLGSIALVFFGEGFLRSLHERITSLGSNSSFGGCRDWLVNRADSFTADLHVWSPHHALPLVLLGLGLWGLGWTTSRRDKRRRLGAVLLASVVVLEVSVFAAKWVVWVDPGKQPLFAETPETAALREHVGSEGRASLVLHPDEHMSRTPFVSNTLGVYGIDSIIGYGSVVPDGMLLPGDTPEDAVKLGRLGVSHLVTWAGNPELSGDWRRVWSSPSMDLYENPRAFPRYLGFLSEDEKDEFLSGTSHSFVPVRETGGKMNSRRIEVPPGTRWLRIAENQAEGWQYRQGEGEWRPVARASDASMLMEVEKSERSAVIEMRYDPPLRRKGFMVSGVSFAGVLLGYVVIRLREGGGKR